MRLKRLQVARAEPIAGPHVWRNNIKERVAQEVTQVLRSIRSLQAVEFAVLHLRNYVFAVVCSRDWRRLLLRPAEVDFADARNGGDEWRIEFAGEAAHFRESEFKRAGHVLARHIAGGEDELPDGMFRESAFFEQVVADTFIRRQQNPAL